MNAREATVTLDFVLNILSIPSSFQPWSYYLSLCSFGCPNFRFVLCGCFKIFLAPIANVVDLIKNLLILRIRHVVRQI